MRALVGLSLGFALGATAFAQEGSPPGKPAAACGALDASLPSGLDDWNGKTGIATAPDASRLTQAPLALARGYEAILLHTPGIAFPVQPEKPGGSVAYAGLFAFTVGQAGNYSVALGSTAWIDVIEDGRVVTPASFGHGPECTTIRKIVVFPLRPGVHTLQVSASPDARLQLMVAKAP